MKKIFLLLPAVALMMQSCFLASLVTTSTPTVVTPPVSTVVVKEQPTTTVVVTQPTVTTVTTNHTTSYVSTPSYVNMAMYLDLNAVAAAFAQANSVRQFEQMLNSTAYMINNLDLNRDGYIDYLRVLEQPKKSGVHTFLIQACVGPNTYTDVATVTTNAYSYVKVTGATPIYGANYYVQPTYTRTPAIYTCLCQTTYTTWSSPYYYNNYPSYYTRPQCYELSHYQAYCKTYVSNNRYLKEEKVVSTPDKPAREQINKTGQGQIISQQPTHSQEAAKPAQHTTGHGQSSTTATVTRPTTSTTTTTTTTTQGNTIIPRTSAGTSTSAHAAAGSSSRTTTTQVRNDGRVNTTINTVTQTGHGSQTIQTTRTTATSNGSVTRKTSSSTTSGHGQR